jgi:hypothetical protein
MTEAQPIDELSALVTWSAALFYWAESDFNDSVNDYWDAYNYVATSLSVGYANIFPVTPLGKTIGAVVQMIGPALSARALNGADAPAEQLGPKLDAILAELQKLNAGNAR